MRSDQVTQPGGLLRLLSPRERILLLICVSILAVSTDVPETMAAVFALVSLGYLTAGLSWRAVRLWLLALLLMWWGTIFSQALFYAQVPRQILFTLVPESFPVFGEWIGGLHVYKQGIEHGVVQALRFGMAMTAGFWVCFSTEPRDILIGASRLGLPRRFAFMLMTGLRFIPLLAREALTVMQAQRLRGMDPKRRVFFAPVATARMVLEPVLSGCVRRSGTLALSVETRGFDVETGDSTAYAPSSSRLSAMIGRGMMLTATALLATKSLLWLYLGGFFYHPSLRPLYAFCQEYL